MFSDVVSGRQGPNATSTSKPKSFYTTDDSTEIATQLRRLGLVLKDVTGDGNCLFRALSDQVHGHANQHPSIRMDICGHIEANRQLYELFIDEDDGTLENRMRRMRKDGTYGGNMEVVAAARTLGADIVVHQSGSPIWLVSSSMPDVSTIASSKPPLHIVYHSWEHYSSVRNINGPHTGLPEIKITPTMDADNSTHSSSHPSSKMDNDNLEPSEVEKTIMKITGERDIDVVRRVLDSVKVDFNKAVVELFEQKLMTAESYQDDHHAQPKASPQKQSYDNGPSSLSSLEPARSLSTSLTPDKPPPAPTPSTIQPSSKKPAKLTPRERKRLQKENSKMKKRGDLGSSTSLSSFKKTNDDSLLEGVKMIKI